MQRIPGPATALLLVALLIAGTATAQGIDPFRRSGFSLSRGDTELLSAAAGRFFEDEAPPVGTVESWSNPKSGSRGTITLIELHSYRGMPCRRLQHDIELRGRADPFRFIVDRCRTPEGEWKIL